MAFQVKQVEVGEVYFIAETREECQEWIESLMRTTQAPDADSKLFIIEEKIAQRFYVSLVRDLQGSYLVIIAKDKDEVRNYLEKEYYDRGTWKLPWCMIYTEEEVKNIRHLTGPVMMPQVVRLV